MKFLQVKLPDDTHEKFKNKCIKNGTDMSNVVKNWINDYLKGV